MTDFIKLLQCKMQLAAWVIDVGAINVSVVHMALQEALLETLLGEN